MKSITKTLKSACQVMLKRRKIERSLRKIAREPDLSGSGQMPDHLETLLRRQMLAEVQQHHQHRNNKELITMITRHKIALATAAVVVATVVIFGIFMMTGSDQMPTLQLPTLAQLAQASEIAASEIDSLRMIGRDTERNKLQDNEQLFKNPFFSRKNFADGGYTIMGIERMCVYDKQKNTFTIRPFDRKVRLQEMGLEPDTTVISMQTKSSMMIMLKEDPENRKWVKGEARIEEVDLQGKPAYKVSVPTILGDLEVYFDKATGLLMKGYIETVQGRMGSEVVEINPELSEDLFSMEPPSGATVIDKTLNNSKGE